MLGDIFDADDISNTDDYKQKLSQQLEAGMVILTEQISMIGDDDAATGTEDASFTGEPDLHMSQEVTNLAKQLYESRFELQRDLKQAHEARVQLQKEIEQFRETSHELRTARIQLVDEVQQLRGQLGHMKTKRSKAK